MRRDSAAAPVGIIRSNLRLGLLACAVVLLTALLAAAPASAAKEVVAKIGGPGLSTEGGRFASPRSIAVNHTGAGAPVGTTYVVDGVNQRIQQFSPSGAFVRAWGWGVKDGDAEFQICSKAATCQKGISGNNAGQLANPFGLAVDGATGNVFVSNAISRRISVFGPSGVFHGAFGWGAQTGAAALQFCTTVSGCSAPGTAAPSSGNIGGGQFGSGMGGLAVDSAGNVYHANPASRRIDVFKPLLTGSSVTGVEWLRSFGWGAQTGAAAFQVCTVAPCKTGATGSNPGQFAINSPNDVTVDSAGNVYAVDTNNRRVQKFDSTPAVVTKEFGAAYLAENFNQEAIVGRPQSVNVQPGSDDVFIAAQRAQTENRLAIAELSKEGAGLAVHGTGIIGLGSSGLAVQAESAGGNIYFTGNDSVNGNTVQALNDTAPTISAPTGVAAREATFHGQVVSNELEVAYRFEYSLDGETWTKAPAPDGVVAAQPGSVPVEQAVSGLEPNADYRVRLSSTRPASGWTLTSAEEEFTTPKVAPTVNGSIATQVTDSGARLVGYLDPEGDATTYRFEYGTTAAYGTAVPVPEANAGDGWEQVTVSELISGLAPGTTYHFRVVATNSSGETASEDATFTTRSSAAVPESRAFELVSPASKNGVDIYYRFATGGGLFGPISTPDGETVLMTSTGPFDGSASGNSAGVLAATRGEDGWSGDPITPVFGPTETLSVPFFYAFSRDFDKGVLVGPPDPPLTPDSASNTANLYLYDRSDDSYRLVTVGAPEDKWWGVGAYQGADDDFEHVVFKSFETSLLEEAPALQEVLYVWRAETETLELVARAPGTNAPFTDKSRIASKKPEANAVSDDGSRIFFYTTVSDIPNVVWVRVDGTSTRAVSGSQATSPDPNGAKRPYFELASSDGSVAFFRSAEKLTDDATTGPTSAGSDLYRYDVDSEELTDITVDPVSANGAEVQGVLGGSEDGTKVYFVARGALAPGAEAGVDNLYLWTDDGTAKGSIELVAAGIDPVNWKGSADFEWRSPVLVTPDGEHALFESSTSLTGYPHQGHLAAYLYDAQSDELTCASCNPLGGPATADAQAFGSSGPAKGDGVKEAGLFDEPQRGRTLTPDGRRVFYNTTEALVPEDNNGQLDVYEYDDQSGQISLVSSGTGKYPAQFQDASADGQDVFFTTRSPLVGIDRDDNVDVYDARVGGGFASQNPPPVTPCVGDGCLPPAPPAPPAPAPASAAFTGAGNQKQARVRRCKPRPKGRKGKAGNRNKQGKRCKAGRRASR